jgi:hypothetical protein
MTKGIKPKRIKMTMVQTKPNKQLPDGGYMYWINAEYPGGRERSRKTSIFGSQDAAYDDALNIQEELLEVEWIT